MNSSSDASGESPMMSGDSGDPVEVACGAFPEALASDLDACDSSSCSDGTKVSAGAYCDGVMDCPDGEDEKDCGGTDMPGTDVFACQDENKVLEISQLCDGTMDCADGADETSVCLPCDEEMTQVYSVYARCDGKKNCESGIDEMGCEFPC